MFIPRVKKEKELDKRLEIGKALVYTSDNVNGDFAAEFLRIAVPSLEISAGYGGKLVFIEDLSIEKGAYEIKNDVSHIVISFSDREGARNAVATFVQMLRCSENGVFFVECSDVSDLPDCKFRSVMIDLARGVPDLQRLKEDLLRIALLKATHIHFHLMDTNGICYETEVFKQEQFPVGRPLLKKSEVKELVQYCDALGLIVIPEIDVPAHANGIINANPEIACRVPYANPSRYVVCAGNEATYSVIEKLIDEIADLFPGPFIHVGGDELYFNDFPNGNNFCLWEDCEICRSAMVRERLSGKQELYYYFMRRLYNMVEAKGRRMILWNDEIDVSAPVPLPKDIIVQYFRIANEYRGPNKGCSYSGFAEQGFSVINSDFTRCYVDMEEYANPEKTSSFCYYEFPSVFERYRNKIIGSEVCAWEYGNPQKTHYKFSFFFSTALLLDKYWNVSDAVYGNRFRKSLTKVLLGPETPEGYDITELFGSIIPPRINGKITYSGLETEMLEEPCIQKHLAVLRSFKYSFSPVFIAETIRAFEEHISDFLSSVSARLNAGKEKTE